MLKKLIKYGNSNALVLDKAILELLEIQEGAILKLKINGKSLMITPTQTKESTQIFSTGQEMVNEVITSSVKTQTEALKADPIKNEQLNQWAPGTDNFIKLTEAFSAIMENYKEDMTLLQTESFSHDVDTLTEKYQNDKTSPKFIKEMLAIRLKHAPNLINMDKEMAEAKKALGCPEDF